MEGASLQWHRQLGQPLPLWDHPRRALHCCGEPAAMQVQGAASRGLGPLPLARRILGAGLIGSMCRAGSLSDPHCRKYHGLVCMQ